jgi:DNA invertase Pin-like site-specific DNA recombinase
MWEDGDEQGQRPAVAVSYARNSSKVAQSIRGQLDGNRQWAERVEVRLVAELSDGVSASRYAKRDRDAWAELLTLVPTVDVVLLWEASRGDRTLSSWVSFLDLCREHGTRIHATGHGTTYDPARPRDYRSLAEDGVDAAYESDKTSMRLMRGFAAAAAAGRPSGTVKYGYEREYHPRTGVFVAQREHPEQADVVREIVRRVGKGEAVSGIARDLSRRGVCAPGGPTTYVREITRRVRKGETAAEVGANLVKRGILLSGNGQDPAVIVAEVVDQAAGGRSEPVPLVVIADELVAAGVLNPVVAWKTAGVLELARDKAYLGIRVHRSKTGTVRGYPALWPALVTEAEFHAAARVLTAPDRVKWRGSRPGRATTLLGHIPVCGTCGDRLSAKSDGVYRCCVRANREPLEALVVETLIARITDPKIFRQLRRAGAHDDKAVVTARAEVDRLTAELDTWRRSAIDGKTTPDSLAVIEAGILAKIRTAQRLADKAGIPPVLRDLVDPDTAADHVRAVDIRARWQNITIAAQRAIIKALMTVTVNSAHGRGHNLTNRVEIAWRES